MTVSDSASPRSVLRCRRPQTRLETSCTRTGRPRRCLRCGSAAGRREKAITDGLLNLRGWKSYFGYCQTPSLLRALDKWIRHRLRSMIWKQWKYGQQPYRQLRQRGVGQDLAASTAGSPHGPWRVALSIALALAYFDSLGLPRRFDGLA